MGKLSGPASEWPPEKKLSMRQAAAAAALLGESAVVGILRKDITIPFTICTAPVLTINKN